MSLRSMLAAFGGGKARSRAFAFFLKKKRSSLRAPNSFNDQLCTSSSNIKSIFIFKLKATSLCIALFLLLTRNHQSYYTACITPPKPSPSPRLPFKSLRFIPSRCLGPPSQQTIPASLCP